MGKKSFLRLTTRLFEFCNIDPWSMDLQSQNQSQLIVLMKSSFSLFNPQISVAKKTKYLDFLARPSEQLSGPILFC